MKTEMKLDKKKMRKKKQDEEWGGYEELLRQQEQEEQEGEELNEWMKEKQLSWKESEERTTWKIPSPHSRLHTCCRQYIHTYTADKAYSHALLLAQIHTDGQTHTQIHTDGWLCAVYVTVCLPIIMNSFKTLMQRHLDTQHSKSFFSHRIWEL